jgi:gas vesicle protein
VSDIDQDRGTGILVAAVVGAAIGAGVALLFAPQSGNESRKWRSRRTREIEDRVGVAFEQSKDVIRNREIPL